MADKYMIESVARAVRSARRGRGLSLDQLAARAGVSKGALAALESATANPLWAPWSGSPTRSVFRSPRWSSGAHSPS